MSDENDATGGDSEAVSGHLDHATASAEDCSVDKEDLQADGLGDNMFSPSDETHDAFPQEELFTPMGPDGLPRMDVESPSQGTPPPLAYDTLVCVEDDRQYVEVWGPEQGDLPPKAFTWMRVEGLRVWDGSPYDADGSTVERRVCARDLVEHKFGVSFVRDEHDPKILIIVRPIRPQCSYYKLQVFANEGYMPGEFGHLDVHRLCTARRSLGGAFLGLTDQAVYCCDFRDPPDLVSRTYMSDRDKARLDSKKHLKMIPALGRPGEETTIPDADDPWTQAKIFGKAH